MESQAAAGDGSQLPAPSLGDILANAAALLHDSAKDAASFQDALSGLLGTSMQKPAGPDLCALQSLDRLTQTLDDLARVMAALSHNADSGSWQDIESIRDGLKLGQLRERLFRDGMTAKAAGTVEVAGTIELFG